MIAIVVAAALTMLGWWRDVGFTPPSEWREIRWLVVPAVIVFLPLLAGVKTPETGSVALLVLGYALTGFAEEAVFRGIVLRLFGDRPQLAAVTTAALLFGLVHLANIFIKIDVGSRSAATAFAYAKGLLEPVSP